jgi:hypothetical protein
VFPIKNGLKQGDALSPLLFNFASEYTFRMVQVNHDGLKINCIHQIWVYADVVIILDGSVKSTKKSTEAFVVASKETELEVDGDKTKYLVLSQDQNA